MVRPGQVGLEARVVVDLVVDVGEARGELGDTGSHLGPVLLKDLPALARAGRAEA